MTIDSAKVGDRIKEARKALAMSQVELAELVHVSARSMQAYESGEVIPYRKAQEISVAINRPIAWILYGDDAISPPGDLAPILERISAQLDQIIEKL